MSAKFVFVTGGVLSGVGKGIVAASLANTLKNRGYEVFLQKFDPYLNVDAGTLNPAEHGECFVTADGAETDLDLGHYERFLDVELTRDSSVMSGAIYRSVIEKERQGKYLGKTIQVIPHVTNEIKERLYRAAEQSEADILVIEIGGTVGDIEGSHFIEVARQVAWERGRNNVLFVHVGYLPYLDSSQETKTKPIQNSIIDLRARGIQPDIVFCRADHPIDRQQLKKIALFGGLPEEAVVGLETIDTVYAVPLVIAAQKVDRLVLNYLKLKIPRQRSNDWEALVRRIRRRRKTTLKIGLVGKYMSMSDTYFSVIEALKAAGWQSTHGLSVVLIDSERVEQVGTTLLADLDGICVPGGFGKRGIKGMLLAIQYARENQIPFLGLCLGMQLATIEYARNVLGLEEANSTEFDGNAREPVITTMSDQVKKLAHLEYGGSMRLGNYPCRLAQGTKARELYGKASIQERHRHRYEFNNAYRPVLEEGGEFIVAGVNNALDLVELIELKDHPYFLACQFHPEFRSRPLRPHPLFVGFVEAAGRFHKDNEPTQRLPLHYRQVPGRTRKRSQG
ncbi:MAG: CTP synthase [Candidatus Berkelbacteria bacterium]|nr:MAG: CTP synthase [Candidatus Berkelbacteria bacterium]QQG51660.1 MAG: CTP synthase [Candidatus Berkelbacteria bacterium]